MKRLLPMLCLLSLPVVAAASPFPLDDAVPGGVAVVALPTTGQTMPHVEFSGQRVMVVRHLKHWYALVGLSLDTVPGDKMLDVNMPGADDIHVGFAVSPKTYAEQDLTIANPEMVNPTPEQLKRIEREQQRLAKVTGTWHDTHDPSVSFIWPVKGPETSTFGLKRVLNGEPKSPHSGIDIAGPTGTAVKAPADARVADIGNYYYCGKTLTLDMGQGLFSVYCHLSKIKVNPGQKVKQGQLVGRIGATGRTTGPNLHWTVRLNEVPVDPHVFLGLNAPTPPPTTPPAPATAPAASTAAAPSVATQTAQTAPKAASAVAPAAATHR
jgi:murein DD-endopeptidase MepM/ murein hydrolase activator NlpD